MRIIPIEVGALGTNCYVVYDDTKQDVSRRECVIIDPGDGPKKIGRVLDENGLTPSAILLTHGHFDHIGAVDDLSAVYPGIKIYAGKNEDTVLQDQELNLTARVRRPLTIKADRLLENNEAFEEAGITFRVIATPGHTMGSVCYQVESENVLFSGDTLFMMSMGRTDFPTGDESQIFASLQKLSLLPDETDVYPGHGGKTCIGDEKRNNPYLQR
ncbi:MAG: MBL fold metallo-hydrolase [Lachnospiraceae bacterium]|nr:MBL fold metallo-hydrolase [Lachnospiraceae bacterium]